MVCSTCVMRVARCAICRQAGPVNVRNRYAERKYFKTSKIVQLRYAEKDSEELRDLLRERDVIMAALTSGAN